MYCILYGGNCEGCEVLQINARFVMTYFPSDKSSRARCQILACFVKSWCLSSKLGLPNQRQRKMVSLIGLDVGWTNPLTESVVNIWLHAPLYWLTKSFAFPSQIHQCSGIAIWFIVVSSSIKTFLIAYSVKCPVRQTHMLSTFYKKNFRRYA